MGEAVAFVGLASLIVGAVARFGASFQLPGSGRNQAGELIGLGLVALLLGGVLMNWDGGSQPAPSRPAPSDPARVKATLHAYLNSNASAEAGLVQEYVPNFDNTTLAVHTRLVSDTGSMAAARRICELARNVIVNVRVEGSDGSTLWTCDRVNSAGNQILIDRAATDRLAAEQADAERVAAAQAEAERQAAAASAQQKAAREDAARRDRAQELAEAPGCHPSYEGVCLPVGAGDVDCAGGNGDGPVYAQTHNLRVIGPDDFGLDSDGDGFGCESDIDIIEPAPEPEPQPVAETPEEPEPSDDAPLNCHPSYGECLPADASDVDCLDGGGNGPEFARTNDFAVSGPDVFDLDRDGDGVACES